MDSSISPKDEIWFLRVCHHISNAVYHTVPFSGLRQSYRRGGGGELPQVRQWSSTEYCKIHFISVTWYMCEILIIFNVIQHAVPIFSNYFLCTLLFIAIYYKKRNYLYRSGTWTMLLWTFHNILWLCINHARLGHRIFDFGAAECLAASF